MTRNTFTHKKGINMKKSTVLIALVCVMVFAFASVAMADHSPQFYFNWQAGAGVTSGTAFQAVFPTAACGLTFSIDNGSYSDETRVPAQGVLADDRKVRRVPLRAPRSDHGYWQHRRTDHILAVCAEPVHHRRRR